MKCYYHNDRDAVGQCKSCGKGLCTQCQVDLGKGLACKERCEEDVLALIEHNNYVLRVTHVSKAYSGYNRPLLVGVALFLLIPGCLMSVDAIMKERGWTFVAMGLTLATFGLLLLIFAIRLPQISKDDQEESSNT